MEKLINVARQFRTVTILLEGDTATNGIDLL